MGVREGRRRGGGLGRAGGRGSQCVCTDVKMDRPLVRCGHPWKWNDGLVSFGILEEKGGRNDGKDIIPARVRLATYMGNFPSLIVFFIRKRESAFPDA